MLKLGQMIKQPSSTEQLVCVLERLTLSLLSPQLSQSVNAH
jgi:hypothetical protein